MARASARADKCRSSPRPRALRPHINRVQPAAPALAPCAPAYRYFSPARSRWASVHNTRATQGTCRMPRLSSWPFWGMPRTSALLYSCGSRPGLSCSARPGVLASSALCRVSEHRAAASALLLARWRISQHFTCLMMSHLHCPGNKGASTDPESPAVRGSSAPLDGPPSVPQTRHQPCISKRRFQRAVECGETSATRCLEARLPHPGQRT